MTPTVSFVEPLHNFLVGPLVVKLRKELEEFRIFSHEDLVANGYHLILKFLGTLPNWYVRCSPRLGASNPDLAIFQHAQPRAVVKFIFALRPEQTNYLPTQEIETEIVRLKEFAVSQAPDGAARGYILVVLDYAEKWFVPTTQEKQRVFIRPINVHEVLLHRQWRPRWDSLKKQLG